MEDTKTCIYCGEEKSSKPNNNKFYSHRNKFINDSFSVCKECVEKIGTEDNIDDIYLLMRLMNLPFIPEKWEDCTISDNTLLTYMSGKGINIPNVKYNDKVIMDMVYSDSPICNEVKDIQKYLVSSDEERLENVTKWGEHYTDAEYRKLNMSVENNIKVTGRDDYQSLRGFERVARAEIERDRAYANQSFKPNDKKAAEDNVTNMMKQAGLSYEQSANRSGEFDIGTDIRDIIENYRPVPEPINEFKDVDFISKYINRFFTIPMMRALGKDNSATRDDYEDIRKEILDRQKSYSGD